MNELTVNNVLFQTIVLGIISVFSTLKLSKTLISASIAYWFGWSFLLIGTTIAINSNWILGIEKQPLYYVMQLNYGAFIGFLAGTIMSPKKNNDKQYQQLIEKSSFIITKFSNKALVVLFLLGLIFLYQRIRRVGFNLNCFENVRSVYLEGNRPFTEYIGTHIGIIVGFLIIMLGVKDAKEGINIKELLKVIIASAPLGLANGSRIFLLNYLILYIASLLISRSTFKFSRTLLKKAELIKISIFLASMLIIFSIIGFTRGGYGDKFDLLFTILIWPVSTIMAMDSWISTALQSQCTNGMFTFGWIVDFMSRIGIMDYSEEKKIINDSISYFITTNNSAAVIPKSIIPDLIFDFGKNGVFWGMLFISFLLQIATLRFAGKGIFFHTFSVLCFTGSFLTIQTSVISPGFGVTAFWAAIFTLYFKFKKNNKTYV